MPLRVLRRILRQVPPYDGYERTIYELLRRKSTDEVSAYCRKRGFSDAETRGLLSLQGLAHKSGYDAFKRLLIERAESLAGTLPFEPRGLAAVEAEQRRSLARMHAAADGRRVVLTGPADYPVGAGRGEWVDSFDWVARINFQWPLPEHLAPDLGRRLDVLYHCCNGDYPVERLFVPGFERARFVCMEHQAHSLRLKRHCVALDIPCLYTAETIARLTPLLGHPPSTGLTAIEHLLSLPIRELQLYGITLWHAPYYAGYTGDGARGAERQPAAVRRRVWRHVPQVERDYLLSLAARDPRVRIDAAALRLMGAGG